MDFSLVVKARSWPVCNPQDEFWLNIGDPVRVESFTWAGIDRMAAAQERIRSRKVSAGALNA
jgi:hypothetical protein